MTTTLNLLLLFIPLKICLCAGIYINFQQNYTTKAGQWNTLSPQRSTESTNNKYLTVHKDSIHNNVAGVFLLSINFHFYGKPRTATTFQVDLYINNSRSKILKQTLHEADSHQASSVICLSYNNKLQFLIHSDLGDITLQDVDLNVMRISLIRPAIGYIAESNSFEFPPSKEKQLLRDWTAVFDPRHGFSPATSCYSFPVGGVYLLSFRLLLTNITESVSLYAEDTLASKVLFHKKITAKTAIFQTVSNFQVNSFVAKNRLCLKIRVNSKSVVSKFSQISIMLLPNSKGSRPSVYNLTENILQTPTADDKSANKIKQWVLGVKSTSGIFSLPSKGFYFVTVTFHLLPQAHGSVNAGFMTNIDNKFQKSVVVKSNNLELVAVSHVLFLQNNIVPYVDSDISLTIKNSTSFTVFKIYEPCPSAVFISEAKNIVFKNVQSNENVDSTREVFSIKNPGVYNVIVKLSTKECLQELSTTVGGASLFTVRTGLYQNEFSFVTHLERDEILRISKKCWHPQCENAVKLSVEFIWLASLENVVGMSVQLSHKTNSFSNHYVNGFSKHKGTHRSFNQNIVAGKDVITIIKSGVYIISAILTLNCETVDPLWQSYLILNVISKSGHTQTFYASGLALNSSSIDISLSKILFLHPEDKISVKIEYETESDATLTSLVSIVRLAKEESKFLSIPSKRRYAFIKNGIFKEKLDKSEYFYYQFKAFIPQSDFNAIVLITLHGELRFTSTYKTYSLRVYIKNKKDSSKSNHSLNSSYTFTKRQKKVTLQLSGLFRFKKDKPVEIICEASDGLEFNTKYLGNTPQSSITLLVFENTYLDTTSSCDLYKDTALTTFSHKILQGPPVSRAGVYAVSALLSSTKELTNEAKKADSLLQLDQNLDRIWQPFNNITLVKNSNQTLFHLSCKKCPSEYFTMLHLKENDTLTSHYPLEVYFIGRRFLYYFLLKNDTELAENALEEFSYRIEHYEVVWISANLLVECKKNITIHLLNGGVVSGTLSENFISSQTTLFQLKKKIYVKSGHQISFHIPFDDKTEIVVKKWSNIAVYRQETIREKDEVDFPVFSSPPTTLSFQYDNKMYISCQASPSASYSWHIIDYTSGRVSLYHENTKNITVSTQANAYYICTATSNGWSVDSPVVTVRSQDIDECEIMASSSALETTSLERCHEQANCTNTYGSYICTCNQGFIGNGTYCQDFNECEGNPDLYACPEHSHCKNTVGSWLCVCENGWWMNNSICYDFNECENATTNDCVENSECLNENGTYRCKCKRGFKGDGKESCQEMGCFPPAHCTGLYKVAWWQLKPYLQITEPTEITEKYSSKVETGGKIEVEGIFKDILEMIINNICQSCSQFEYKTPVNNSRSFEEMEKKTHDFVMAVYGRKDMKEWRGHPYIPLLEAPGVAFYAFNEKPATSPLVASLVGSWPILVVTLLLAAISGVVIWFLDTLSNPDEFTHRFVEGSWNGFWWAVVTMTTVGYGDKSPRSFMARVFSIVWILIGLVIISTFTGTLTTAITASSMGGALKLNGLRIGALVNSEEHRVGVKKNAETIEYYSIEAMLEALKKREVVGVLLDPYLAGEYQDRLANFTSLELQEILDTPFAYGMVLVRDAEALEGRIRAFFEEYHNTVFELISSKVKRIKKKSTAPKVQASASIFDPSSTIFLKIIVFGCSLFGVLAIIGLLWDFCYLRKRRKPTTLVEAFAKTKVMTTAEDIAALRNEIRYFGRLWTDRLDCIERQQRENIENQRKYLDTHSLNGERMLMYDSFEDYNLQRR